MDELFEIMTLVQLKKLGRSDCSTILFDTCLTLWKKLLFCMHQGDAVDVNQFTHCCCLAFNKFVILGLYLRSGQTGPKQHKCLRTFADLP